MIKLKTNHITYFLEIWGRLIEHNAYRTLSRVDRHLSPVAYGNEWLEVALQESMFIEPLLLLDAALSASYALVHFI